MGGNNRFTVWHIICQVEVNMSIWFIGQILFKILQSNYELSQYTARHGCESRQWQNFDEFPPVETQTNQNPSVWVGWVRHPWLHINLGWQNPCQSWLRVLHSQNSKYLFFLLSRYQKLIQGKFRWKLSPCHVVQFRLVPASTNSTDSTNQFHGVDFVWKRFTTISTVCRTLKIIISILMVVWWWW